MLSSDEWLSFAATMTTASPCLSLPVLSCRICQVLLLLKQVIPAFLRVGASFTRGLPNASLRGCRVLADVDGQSAAQAKDEVASYMLTTDGQECIAPGWASRKGVQL